MFIILAQTELPIVCVCVFVHVCVFGNHTSIELDIYANRLVRFESRL